MFINYLDFHKPLSFIVLYNSAAALLLNGRRVVFVYIVVGSITTASRLAKLIEKTAGIPADVVHTPSAIKSGGCSYSVRVFGCTVGTIKKISYEYGINIKAIYAENFSGREREYRDIS